MSKDYIEIDYKELTERVTEYRNRFLYEGSLLNDYLLAHDYIKQWQKTPALGMKTFLDDYFTEHGVQG